MADLNALQYPSPMENRQVHSEAWAQALALGELVTDPERAEQLGLTADARRMRAERAITTVVHIEGAGGTPKPVISIAPGTSLKDLAEQLGVTLRTEYRREPWTPAELDRAKLEARVVELRDEFPTGDYPAPIHPADEPCTECEALRFLHERS